MADDKRSSTSVTNVEHHGDAAHEKAIPGNTHLVAERGHLATDQFGHSLLEFDPKAEAKLRFKIDLMIVPTVSILYLFCFIDRANIGNAKISGFDVDLNLKGYDYNLILSVFYISYIVFEIPVTVLCKWMGPGWFIPATTLCFGVCSIATGFVHTKESACGVRFLLGLFEAGMMPGISYYLSRWYRQSELAFRLGLFIVMAPLAGAFGGLLASGIMRMDSFGGVRGWRMIFVVEGIITVFLGLISFLLVTDRPATARWLSAEERDLAIARVKSERIGATEVLDGIDKKKLMRGMLNPVTLGTAFTFLLCNITVQGLAFFAPTIVKTIYPTKSVVQLQLFTVPPYVVGGFFTVLLPYFCTVFNKRQIFVIMSAPLTMIGYILFLSIETAQVRYGAIFLVASAVYAIGPISNAQVSANVVSDTARSSALGLNVMFGNMGGLISTWSFLPNDAPNYRIGNGINLATNSLMLIVSILVLLWMKRDNKKRDGRNTEEELSGMSLHDIQDLEWKHPAFRWKP
ncbi:major facilitator superfamily domain-containing protein [Podospora appendiculata]|uniref:Major facilitator superfamily domain-containing protein n=1 Tax=Podospora appendiculata TaxID=314037 RepID=A0AAE1C838_9PEZI|nr:major facilitator superfamily domain-containing protein [Podospora appendiculata]